MRTKLQTLTRHQVDRLPPTVQEEHAAWVAASEATPTPEERRTRARRLALSLLELGEAPEAVELQLHRWKFHPGMAHEALRWAEARRDDRRPTTVQATAAAAPIPTVRRARPTFSPSSTPSFEPSFDTTGDAA